MAKLPEIGFALLSSSLMRYFGALVARATEVIGKLGLYVLAAREMGGYESGLFFLCLTWVNFASTVARLGLERAMSRHVAAEMAVGNGAGAKHAIAVGMRWTMLGSLTACALTLIFAEPAARLVFNERHLVEPLRIAAAILLPQSLAFALGFVLIGIGRGIVGQMVQSALPPVLSLCAIMAGFRHVDSLLAAYALSYTICCGLGAAYLARDWCNVTATTRAPKHSATEPLPRLRTTAHEFLVVEMVQAALLAAPVLVLGAVADAVAVSAFSVTFRITNMINTVLISLTMISAPAFARHHRLREYSALRQAERQTRLLAMLVCLPLIATLLLFCRALLSLLGTDFTIAHWALVILSVGQIVNVLLPTQDMMLAMTGHTRILRRNNLGQLVVCCLLCATLIPAFQLMGAAIAAALCLSQGRIGFAMAVRRVVPELSGRLRSAAT